MKTVKKIRSPAMTERINAPIASGVRRNLELVFIRAVIKNNEKIYSAVSTESFRLIVNKVHSEFLNADK
jgi:hypothetical protein